MVETKDKEKLKMFLEKWLKNKINKELDKLN